MVLCCIIPPRILASLRHAAEGSRPHLEHGGHIVCDGQRNCVHTDTTLPRRAGVQQRGLQQAEAGS